MQAGRELDLLVAIEVMGYIREVRTPGPAFVAIPLACHRDGPVVAPDGNLHFLPKYSTDITQSWAVVEKLRTKFDVTIFALKHDNYVVEIHPEGDSENRIAQIVDESVAKAICLAALAAKGVHLE